jgi:hypothetical protein
VKYAISYVHAYSTILGCLGSFYLVTSAFYSTDFFPKYLLFIAVLGAIGGPISVLLRKNNEN